MKLLLDTHVILWLATDIARVPPVVTDAIVGADAVCVSVASAWEYGAKRQRRPDELSLSFEELLAGTPAQRVGLDYRLAAYSERLPPIHGDPFDRMLIAQAIDLGLVLVTRDEIVRRYDVKTLW